MIDNWRGRHCGAVMSRRLAIPGVFAQHCLMQVRPEYPNLSVPHRLKALEVRGTAGQPGVPTRCPAACLARVPSSSSSAAQQPRWPCPPMPLRQGIKVAFVAAGASACHTIIGDVNGVCYTWGRNEVRGSLPFKRAEKGSTVQGWQSPGVAEQCSLRQAEHPRLAAVHLVVTGRLTARLPWPGCLLPWSTLPSAEGTAGTG